ncbi:hypothetical protein Tco_0863932 [Tanacetum coccineum]
MNNMGFWREVIAYFEKEMGETRGYDAITTNGKIGITLLEKEWKWLTFTRNKKGSKKSKVSKTTSESTQGAFNFNDEADGSEEEIREERPIVRDQIRRKYCPPLVLNLHLLEGLLNW